MNNSSNAGLSVQTSLSAARPFQYRDHSLFCDDVDLHSLAAEFGTPLYVYSASHILERLKMFQEAFNSRPHTVCFAVKANSSLAILKLLAEAGAGFDIVSGGELARVCTAAPEARSRTVFAGVGKQAAELDAALNAGILFFNVESGSELRLLEQRAQSLGVQARVSLRVNPDVVAETHAYISTGQSEHKFGIPLAEAVTLYRVAAASPHLQPVGISVHIGSQIREVAPFGDALRRVRALLEQLAGEGIRLTHLDAGGGLGIEYTEADFDPRAAVQAYAEQVLAATAGLDVHLVIEPGRFLVAQAGALLTEVVHTKQNGEKHFTIVDAAMNDLIRPALYKAHHEIVPVTLTDSAAPLVMDIVGPVCETSDFFARGRELPPQQSGDLLAILDAGAYGMTLASNYNSRPRPAEVLVQDGAARLIRRRETMADLFATELV